MICAYGGSASVATAPSGLTRPSRAANGPAPAQPARSRRASCTHVRHPIVAGLYCGDAGALSALRTSPGHSV